MRSEDGGVYHICIRFEVIGNGYGGRFLRIWGGG